MANPTMPYFPVTPSTPSSPQAPPMSPATPSGPITSTQVAPDSHHNEAAKLRALAEAAWLDELAHVKAALQAEQLGIPEEAKKMWVAAAERARLQSWLERENPGYGLDSPKPMPLTHGQYGTGDQRAAEYDSIVASESGPSKTAIALGLAAALAVGYALTRWL